MNKKKWEIKFWNDWTLVSRRLVDLTLLRLNFDYMQDCFISLDFVILGFGFQIGRIDPADAGWLDPIGSLGRDK